MREEIDLELCKKYPDLYKDRHNVQSSMYYGFNCGDGWYKVIEELSLTLENINNKLPNNKKIKATQIKEKFGTLSIHLSSYPKEFEEEITEALRKAKKICDSTCEVCGSCGVVRNNLPWIHTLCDECYTNIKNENT